MSTNLFAGTNSKPGHGTIKLSLLPPSKPVLEILSYQYPLKLIAPAPVEVHSADTIDLGDGDSNGPREQDGDEQKAVAPSRRPHLVHTVFLLTYGGGLVAGDSIHLSTTLAPSTRLILLTQGSTKIFKSPSPTTISRQHTTIHLHSGAALCYLPDPVQPFAESAFEQVQIYKLIQGGNDVQGKGIQEEEKPSLCVLDWVTSGRSARGENWSFHHYSSKNEIWLASPAQQQEEQTDTPSTPPESDSHPDPKRTKDRLLFRDNLILSPTATTTTTTTPSLPNFPNRMSTLSIFGTLLLHGPLLSSLSTFFLSEFEHLPRIGARKWDTATPETLPATHSLEHWRTERVRQEEEDGVLWTAARVRGGCVVVKFGARTVEGGRRWVAGMVGWEGSVGRVWGERAGLCLR